VRCLAVRGVCAPTQKGAFYACEDIRREAEVEIVDNTICQNSVLNFEKFGVWCGLRRPPRLTVRGNRENW